MIFNCLEGYLMYRDNLLFLILKERLCNEKGRKQKKKDDKSVFFLNVSV
jgi:hypothetical protein